ncbi:alpha/beta hydrolase [Sporosarcina limicola]|uniref:Lysophospholipase n=1 Tax=Sporosarcina limicola TaxID=34101 RepID=A0A927MLS1_9BACL|nr:alpha/beta hydrolase [Sporosarcina limicola]MBE1555442.1 lysophospholipase [Sporosarcina limicola]
MWKWEAEGQPKAVVVIVHNAYEHHNRYAWLIQKLRSSGFHVVTGDLPGHGVEKSKKIHNEKFETYEEFVKKLITIGLTDSLPLFVIGHGLGATLMMRILQTEKVECAGFVFSSPWLSLIQQPSKFSIMLMKLTSSMKMNHEITIELLTRKYDLYTEGHQGQNYSSIMTAAWYRELQTLMKSVARHEGTIQNVPVLMQAAGSDKITDIAQAKKWFINQGLSEFQYKEWKRLYHDVFQEPEREEVYLYTESFMNNVLRSLGYIV